MKSFLLSALLVALLPLAAGADQFDAITVESVVRSMTSEKFSQNFAVKKGVLEEVMYAPETKIFGDLALVWGRYVFFVDNKISHCGVNAFHLARTDNGWRIANASTTIEPQGCTEKEKAIKPGAAAK